MNFCYLYNTGVITQSALTQKFPDYDSEMIIEFLCYMKLSMEITSDMLAYSNSENSNKEEKFLFVPALIRNAQRPQADEINGRVQFGWCLQCSNPHQFFLPRFFHVLLLHLAYNYALDPMTTGNPLNRRCTIWTNGILWSDNYGVQTLVEIIDNSRCVLLLMSCLQGFKRNMVKLCKKVINDILSHKKDTCPRLELQEFIIDHDPTRLEYPVDSSSSLTLYDIEQIADCVVHKKPVAVSCNNEGKIRTKITDLLPFDPDTLSVFAGRSPEVSELINKSIYLMMYLYNYIDFNRCKIRRRSVGGTWK